MGKKGSGPEDRPQSKRVNGWHKGSIEVLPSGSLRWSVRVKYPDGTGERRKGTVRTKTEAQRAIIKAQEEAAAGLKPVADRLTVGEIVTEFMEGKKATWAEKTAFNNEQLYLRHVAPHLAHLKAAGIDPKRLRAYFALLSTERPRPDGKGNYAPLAHSGQRQIHVLLSGAYKRAISDGLLRDNPALHARPISPAKQGGEGTRPAARLKHFTPEQLGRFVAQAMSGDERSGYALAFVGLTGLRIGEALGLTWEDLHEDPEARGAYFVEVTKTQNEIGSEYKRTTPKTPSSVRSVYLSGAALSVLEEMRRRIAIESKTKFYKGHGLAPDAPIFPALDGRFMRQDVARAVMRRLCVAAGVPLLSPHALRHSVGTFHIASGADPVTVAKHLGHAQVSTTLNIYAHALPDKLRGMALDLTQLGSPAKEEAPPLPAPTSGEKETGRKGRAGLRPKKTLRRRKT